MKDKKIYIEKLLERFFEGETTNKEEKELYEFFNSKDVPETLTHYKEMFVYFEQGIYQEVNEIEKEITSDIKKTTSDRWMVLIAGVAATLLLLMMLKPFISFGSDSFHPYEGSYIVKNGEKITDLEKIMPELERVNREADTLTQEMEEISQEAEELMQRIEKINIHAYQQVHSPSLLIEERVNTNLENFLDNFPDEMAREEVRKILDI